MVLFISMTYTSFSQNTIIPTTGSNTMTADGTLCTSPGCGSTYYNNANGYTVLSNNGSQIINVYSASSSVETSYDYVRIFDGTGTGGTLLYTFTSQPGTINYTGALGQTLTVLFQSDAGTGFTGLNATVTFTNFATWTCGSTLSVNHTAGTVAPVSKTVNYGTVTTNLSGSNKCWITQNLGSDQQAISASDATEPSAGWYWQFNRLQGYKHDGAVRTPSTTWITSISENSDWVAANDPCTSELGSSWRIPTQTEWTNVNADGAWANLNNAYASVLKLHAAGYVDYNAGGLSSRGSYGFYWGSTQIDLTSGRLLYLGSSFSSIINNPKAYGYSLRCIKDDCTLPSVPSTITGTATQAPGATGQTYSISAVTNATTYTWTVPTGWTITAGQGTTAITVTTGATGQNGNISVTAGSVCGTSTAQYLPVTVVWACGSAFPITHTAGSVSPVSKTVNYGTVTTNLSGSNKCWITQNLGSSNQATAATDATEPSAGWYWQFNRLQGYKHDGAVRTPSTTWITSISENSDWVAANDPCTYELGSSWRIPTQTEWTNVNADGAWANLNNAYASVLKLHAAGYLQSSVGSLTYRGTIGNFWSSTQSSNSSGSNLSFSNTSSTLISSDKASGFTLRCLKDSCSSPYTPGAIIGPPSQCPSSTGQVYSITVVSGATTYTWTVPAGWVITSGQGSTGITVTTGTAGQNGNITVTAGNTCGTSTASYLAVTVNPISIVSVSISVSANPVCFGDSVKFTATPVNGGTTPVYQWKVNGNTAGINSATYTSNTLSNNDVVTCEMTSNATPCATGSPATSNSITMIVYSLPILSIGGLDSVYCLNHPPVPMTGHPVGGSFTGVGVMGNIFSPSVAGTGTWDIIYYYADPNGCTNSDTVSVVVNPSLTAGTVASDQTICYNTSPVPFINVTLPTGGGGTYTYQWQYQPVCSGAWTDITGATATTYDVPGILYQPTCYRRNVISVSCGSGCSNTISVSINGNLTGGTIGNSQSICYNTPPGAFINILLPSGISGPYTYQWQQQPGCSGAWGNISGTNSSTYNYTGNLTQSTCFRRGATVSCDTAYSDVITVTVNISVGGTVSSSQTICDGSEPADITLSGYSGTIQWQYSNDGASGWTNISGATAATLTSTEMGTITSDRWYRAGVTNSPCGVMNSNPVKITVSPTSVGGNISGGGNVCFGNTSGILTVSGNTGNVIKWQKSIDNGTTWTDISNTTTTYISGALTQSTQFRAVVQSGTCPVDNTTSATVVVTPDNTIALMSAVGTNNQTICINTPITTISYSTTGATGATFNNLPSGVSGSWTANVATINGTPSVSGIFNYDVILTGGCGNVVQNGTLTVIPIPVAPSGITGISTQCPSLTGQTYSITAVSGATTYNWVIPTGWVITSGQGTIAITVTTGAAGQNGNISVTAGNSCGNSTESYLAVTVNAVDVSVTQNNNTLTANASGAGYQWVNCNNSFAIIAGETHQSFTASANGNYAVIVTQGSCSDTSTCVQITTVGITSIQKEDIYIYPNPTSNELIIEMKDNKNIICFEIYNSLEQLVFKGNFIDKAVVQTTKLSPGVYLIKLVIGNTLEYRKIIKE